MKTIPLRPIATALLAACIVSGVGCYPAYPPPNAYSGYNNDSKGGYAGPAEPAPPPQYAPRYVVDPGLVIAGAAAAGLVGYAIGQNHGYHHGHGHYYGGPRYYGRGYYRPRHYHH